MNNNIQEDYCSFEVSKLLEEKGFDIRCRLYYHTGEILKLERVGWYNELCEAPTHALAIKWVRENFGFHIWIDSGSRKWIWTINDLNKQGWYVQSDDRDEEPYYFDKPEEATEAALLYTLQNLIK